MFGLSGWKKTAAMVAIVVVLVLVGATIQARKPFVQSVPVVGAMLAGTPA